jgi:hypothetical protein
MSGSHRPEHEPFVQSVVTGDRSREDEEIRQLRADCSECEAELEQLAWVQAALDAVAQEDHAVIALAQDQDDAVADAAAARFREHPEFRRMSPQRSTGRSARRAAAWSAAAALMLIATLRFRGQAPSIQESEPAPEPGVLLGGPSDRIRVDPIGSFEPDLTLRFDVDGEVAAAAAEYELVVEGSDANGSRPYFQTFRLRATTWSDPEQVRGFPNSIQVTVRALSASGVELARSEPVTGSRAH